MATESKNNSQEKIFVGIDVGTRNWAVSMVSSEGELLERMNVIEAEFEIFRKILANTLRQRFTPSMKRGAQGFHLHRQLESIGVKNIITPPNRIPTLTGDLGRHLGSGSAGMRRDPKFR